MARCLVASLQRGVASWISLTAAGEQSRLPVTWGALNGDRAALSTYTRRGLLYQFVPSELDRLGYFNVQS